MTSFSKSWLSHHYELTLVITWHKWVQERWQAAEDLRSYGQLGSVRNEDKAFFKNDCVWKSVEIELMIRIQLTAFQECVCRVNDEGFRGIGVWAEMKGSVSLSLLWTRKLTWGINMTAPKKSDVVSENAQISGFEQLQRWCFHICESDGFNLRKVKCLTVAYSHIHISCLEFNL